MKLRLFALCTLFFSVMASAVPSVEPAAADKMIARIVTSLLQRSHFQQYKLDDAMASKLADQFLRTLDGNRMYLLASDVEEFMVKERLLDDWLKQGNVDAAFVMFDRLLERVQERVAKIEASVDAPYDFTVAESFVPERKNAAWCKTVAELDEVWRVRLKNAVLNRILIDEQKAEAAAKLKAEKEDDAAEDVPEAKEEDEPDAKTDADDADDEGEEEDDEDLSPAERVLKSQKDYFHRLEQYESIDVLELYLSAFARCYDPHSTYMAPDTKEDFDISMKLSLTGIGARLRVEDSYVKIVDLIAGGPAFELEAATKDKVHCVQAGDLVIGVAQSEDQDPVNVIDMPLRKVVSMIRGEKGKPVYLTILKHEDGVGGTPSIVKIVRDTVKLTANEAKSKVYRLSLDAEKEGLNEAVAVYPKKAAEEEVAGDKEEDEDEDKDEAEDEKEEEAIAPIADHERHVVVVQLPSFYLDFAGRRAGKKDYKSSTRDVRNLISQAIEEHNAAGVILDLRSNGGGSLDEAISMSGLFFDKGPVVQVMQMSNGRTNRRIHEDRDGVTVYDGPLVVLVDKHSASASEIVAACIQDYQRGVIVGEASTHGKGTVQNVHPLNRVISNPRLLNGQDPGSLKFTVAKFYRVNGGSTQVKGVIPDIIWPSQREHLDIGEASLDGVLPWDSISARPPGVSITVADKIPALRERSEARRQKDERFTALTEYIEEFRKRQEDKTVLLHKEQRQAQRDSERESREDAREKMYGKDAKGRDADLLLDESLNILADLIQVNESKKTAE
ncbi:MAG: carboxyl-terminal processing protease [Rhodothermales bacterium]|jgi:carboxyl-terminal processing protease